jgi:16S rRNA (uracil1498-N3)-methyltransferase
MPPRLFVDLPLSRGLAFSLPGGPARHVQVLRLQPGAPLILFDGRGGEWRANVTHMGRSDVKVQLDAHDAVDRELPLPVTLALGMPANERMDTLVEKATELGVAAIQPLVCQRSVLRLSGERAQKKVVHWQAVAVAACEQCGRTRVPRIEPVRAFDDWLARLGPVGTENAESAGAASRVVLSFAGAPVGSVPAGATNPAAGVLCLSGPEGGLADDEEAAALAAGFLAVSLGARVLRADTAPLALLSHLGLVTLLGPLAPAQPGSR